MTLKLKKMNAILVPHDPVSIVNFAALDDGVYTAKLKPVTAKANEELRREAQNVLYWDCLQTLVKAELEPEWTKEDWHREFKRLFLLPIFVRTKPVYARLMKSIEAVALTCGKLTTDDLQAGIIELLSTREATVLQFSEYLSQVIHFCRQHEVVLRIDEDLLAMAEGEQ